MPPSRSANSSRSGSTDKDFHVHFRLTSSKPMAPKVIRSLQRVLPVFQQQPGFIGCNLLHSHDRKTIVLHLRWRTKADHEACQKGADFSAVAKDWEAVFAAGRVRIETYASRASLQGP